MGWPCAARSNDSGSIAAAGNRKEKQMKRERKPKRKRPPKRSDSVLWSANASAGLSLHARAVVSPPSAAVAQLRIGAIAGARGEFGQKSARVRPWVQ